MRRWKQHILYNERLNGGKNISERRRFNVILRSGGKQDEKQDGGPPPPSSMLKEDVKPKAKEEEEGDMFECGEADLFKLKAFVHKAFSNVTKYVSLSTTNCTATFYGSRLHKEEEQQKYYIKLLTDRQANYYVKINSVIGHIHAPYSINRGDSNFMWSKSYGVPLNKIDSPEIRAKGDTWVIKTLQYLHDEGVYHGDIIAGHDRINDSNVLYDEEQGFRLIDFGPVNNEHRTDDQMLEHEKQLLQDYVKKENQEQVAYEQLKYPSAPRRKKGKKRNQTERKKRKIKMNEASGSSSGSSLKTEIPRTEWRSHFDVVVATISNASFLKRINEEGRVFVSHNLATDASGKYGDKGCWANVLVDFSGTIYIGWVLFPPANNKDSSSYQGFCIPHAWLVKNGSVIERTPNFEGTYVYFGVPIDHAEYSERYNKKPSYLSVLETYTRYNE